MMIRSAALIMVLAVIIPAALFRAEAQPVARAYRIGVVAAEGVLASQPFDAFVHGLRDLGYVEGRNLSIEYRQAMGGPEQYRAAAAELAALRVDIIVTLGTPATLAAKAATTTIPIVVASAGDLVGTGVIASLARPGGNVTGLTLQSPELTGKRLALMKEVVPGVRKAIVLMNRNNPLHESIWKESQSAAHALNVDLEALRVGAPDELEGAFATATRRPAGVLMVPLDSMFNGQRRRLVALAAKHALPTMYGDRLYAEAGGLIAYGASYSDNFRRAATYVDRILKGAKPADLPVEQPTKFELVVNQKTAKALGLAIPPALLLRADEVIQ